MTMPIRAYSLHHGIQMEGNEIKKITTVSFNIPDTPAFPQEYKGGNVEVAVWPSPGVMPSVLEREGGLERLEDWTINNILLGYIEGDYTEMDLRQDFIWIRASSKKGKVLLDTFGPLTIDFPSIAQ